MFLYTLIRTHRRKKIVPSLAWRNIILILYINIKCVLLLLSYYTRLGGLYHVIYDHFIPTFSRYFVNEEVIFFLNPTYYWHPGLLIYYKTCCILYNIFN